MRFHRPCPMWEYTKNSLSLLAHTLGTTRQQPIKLDHIKGNTPKSCGARGPKWAWEMNYVPKTLWSSRLVLKNPNISFPPHNPHQSKTSELPQHLASNVTSQSFIWDNHHVTYTLRRNSIHMSPTELHSPKLKGQCRKIWSTVSPLSIHNKQTSGLRAL